MRQLILLSLLISMPGAALAVDTTSVDLRYRSYRNWSLQLPAEKWFAVKDGINIPHANGDLFSVKLAGNELRFDTDGDGELDRTIKPLTDDKTGVSTTRVVLSGTDKQGKDFRYAVRLREDAKGWEWAPGGAVAGIIDTKAGPTPIRVIDQNGNGKFNDIGQDALIVGGGKNATFLSKTIFADDRLQNIDIAADGSQVTLSKFTGPTATIDMTTSFDSKAVLLAAILLSDDKQHSFDVGAIDGPVQVPVGTYTVASGLLGLGDHRVRISAGKMKPLRLHKDQTEVVDWGGPVKSEFRFARAGDKVQFSPTSIWYFGDAGEEYSNWFPIGKSPEFKVRNSDTGVVMEVAILPGSC